VWSLKGQQDTHLSKLYFCGIIRVMCNHILYVPIRPTFIATRPLLVGWLTNRRGRWFCFSKQGFGISIQVGKLFMDIAY
jgi:hypothetical protein